MNIPSSGSSYVLWLPALPLPSAPYKPLHFTPSACNVSFQILPHCCCHLSLLQPLPANAVTARDTNIFASVKTSRCWSFADFQKAGWPVTQASNLSFPFTLFFPICWIFLWISVAWKRKHELVFFLLSHLTSLASCPHLSSWGLLFLVLFSVASCFLSSCY